MAETHKPGTSQIRFEGVFDWPALYHLMHNWFVSRKYKFYEDKNVRKPGTFGYEVEYEAHGVREESDYVRYTIDLKIHGYHMEDVEVIVDGEKKQRTKTGMFVIELSPVVELDWHDRMQKTTAKQRIRKFLHKHIMKRTVEEWVDKLYYECYLLQTKIREELNLENKYSAYAPWSKRNS